MINKQRLEEAGMDDSLETVQDILGDELCDICNSNIEKSLSPTNPTCEGRWCQQAVDIWLEMEFNA